MQMACVCGEGCNEMGEYHRHYADNASKKNAPC